MRRFTNFKLGGVVLTLLFLLGVSGSSWGQEVLKSGNFKDLSSYSYTADKTVEVGEDTWLVSTSQLNSGTFYLGCNSKNEEKGFLNSSTWGDVITAIQTQNSSFDAASDNAYAMRLKLDGPMKNVYSIQFDWAGANNSMDVYLFINTGSGFMLASQGQSKNGSGEAGTIRYEAADMQDVEDVVLVAIPTSANKTLRVTTYEITTRTSDNQVQTPAFSPKSGTSFAGENLLVTISCATEDANIYYTTNGEEPTTSSTPYTGSFNINATTTVKAIAVKDGMENSDVVTATYTKVEALSIAEFKATTGEQFLNLENAVVTAVGSNDIFIQDAEGNGIDLFHSGQDYEVGDVLNGVVKGTSTAYRNMPELTDGDYSSVTVTKGGTASPKVVTIAELLASPETYYCTLVKIEDATYENEKFIQEDGVIDFYDKFNTIADGYAWPSLVDVTGVFTPYNNDLQLSPRTEADIENASGLDVPTFAWSAASYLVDINDAAGASYPTLTNTSDGKVAYESSNTEVATIDATTGEITLVAAGSTTITASVAATDNYSAASASYTLKVIDASALPEPQAIVAEKNGEYYAMLSSSEISKSKLDAIQVLVWNGNVVRTAGASDFAWYIDESEGTIVNAAGEYATHSGKSTDLEVGDSKFIWIKTSEGYWASSTNNERVLGLSVSNEKEVFAVPSLKATQNQFATAMPIVDGYTRTVTSGNYGTICLPYAVSAGDYDGVEFFSVAGKVTENGEATAIVLNEETELEAGKPYVFSATTDKLIAIYSGEAASAEVDGNGLVGSFSGTTVNEGMYLLKDNTVKLLGEAGGRIEANRAYFDLGRMSEYTEAVGVNQRLISLGGSNDDGTTGVEGIAAEEDALVDVYTIDGVMVRSQVAASGATDGLAKGLYIVDGKKVVVK